MSNEMNELEQDLDWIFRELDAGMVLSKDQIETLKYACGFNPRPACIEHLDKLFNDFGNIFRSNK